MSRTRLSLYEVDAKALASFADELRAALIDDDRDRLAAILKLEGASSEAIRSADPAVFLLLAAESYAPAAPVFAALRRAAQARALRRVWTAESLSLEGRLRGFEPLREQPETARRVDALLDGFGVPWFLRPRGASCGSLPSGERSELAMALEELDDAPPEITDFGRALADLQGDALCHDTL